MNFYFGRMSPILKSSCPFTRKGWKEGTADRAAPRDVSYMKQYGR